MFEKERLEKDALNRILWDKSLNPNEFSVHYLDRFEDGLVEVGFADIRLDGDFFVSGDAAIPMHRIREIRKDGKIVWKRRQL